MMGTGTRTERALLWAGLAAVASLAATGVASAAEAVPTASDRPVNVYAIAPTPPIAADRAPIDVPAAPIAADRVPTPVAAVPVAADRVPTPVAAVPVAADRVPTPIGAVPVAADRAPTPLGAVPVAADRAPAPVAATPIAADGPDRVATPTGEPPTSAPSASFPDGWTFGLIAALALGALLLAAALILARRHGPVPRAGA